MKRLLILMTIMMVFLTGCKAPVKSPDVPFADYNVEGERVVLYHGEKEFPISYTVDGAQKIENGTYFYYELNQKFGRDWDEPFYLYHPISLELMDYREYGALDEKACFATNGNWPLFFHLSP